MIVPLLVAIGVAGAGGYILARRGMFSEKEVKRRIDESKQEALMAAAKRSVEGTPLPQDAYRPPDPAAVINTPVDAEDFAQMKQAFCVCYQSLLEDEGTPPTAEKLRDTFLGVIYPDFTWPPVPGDPSGAQLMWLIAGHEANKLLLDPSVCAGVESPREEVA